MRISPAVKARKESAQIAVSTMTKRGDAQMKSSGQSQGRAHRGERVVAPGGKVFATTSRRSLTLGRNLEWDCDLHSWSGSGNRKLRGHEYRRKTPGPSSHPLVSSVPTSPTGLLGMPPNPKIVVRRYPRMWIY